MATTWLLNCNLRQVTLDWGRNWLVDFDTGKTKLVLFDWSYNNGAIDVKRDGLFLRRIIFHNAGIVFLFQIALGLLHYLYC